MFIRLIIISALSLLLAQAVYAQPNDWMTKTSPQELGMFVHGGEDCPQINLSGVVATTLVEQHVVPRDAREQDEVYIDVRTLCIATDRAADSYVFHVEVFFGRHHPSYGWIYFDDPYRSLGTGRTGLYLRAIKQQVEFAMADYAKANMITEASEQISYSGL